MANIIVGVSGSISAYKAPDLVRLLIKAGHSVQVILSNSASRFVSSLSLATVSERPVITDESVFSPDIPHLKAEKESDIFLVAPCTGNMLAKLANGVADDALSSAFLAFTGPKVVAPAMHPQMLLNPVTQDNLKRLRSYGVHVLGPDRGDLASGDSGLGRLVDLNLLALAVDLSLSSSLDLSGRRVLITAGGTSEKIDSVRTISNLSSGKLGHNLAHLAAFFGAQVRLITTTPLAFQNPHIEEVIPVISTADMESAVHCHLSWSDTLIMAAAVSDFTVPASDKKIKRSKQMTLDLMPTADILKSVAEKKEDRCFVGFCLEDNNLLKEAKRKLTEKNLDVIVANGSENLGADKRSAHILKRNDDDEIYLSDISVHELASKILEQI